MTSNPEKIVVMGMGNLLLRDEGIGVHIAHAMQKTPPPANMELEIVDGGTLPDAPFTFENIDKLIIVDAVETGGEPGAIYRFRPEDLGLNSEALTSLHQISLLENLWLMERFTQRPREVVIIGVEPEDMNWGLELSATLQQKIPQIIKVVMDEVGSDYSYKAEKGEQKC